jgi:hypothetical protein
LKPSVAVQQANHLRRPERHALVPSCGNTAVDFVADERHPGIARQVDRRVRSIVDDEDRDIDTSRVEG